MTYEGCVLLDNTTVFGARSAWETWPVRAEEWFEGSLAVNVRSLMDILESIILHDRILVDASSRDRSAWPDLSSLSDANGRTILLEKGFTAAEPAVASLLVRSSIGRLRGALANGTFAAYLDEHRNAEHERILPVFYEAPHEFARLTLDSFGRSAELSNEAVGDLQDIEHALSHLPRDLVSLATFVFRGFYYEDLAHLYSVSYVPHTWRAAFLDDPGQRLPDFGRYVLGAASELREELSRRLNNEFGRTVFTEEFPVMASYVAAHTTSRHDLLQTAVQIRESESATRFRSWVAEIESSVRDQRGLKDVNRARTELRTTLESLGRELGVRPDERARQKIKIKVGVPVASAETDFALRAPGWLDALLHRRTHLTFLRQLAIESTTCAPFVTSYHKLTP